MEQTLVEQHISEEEIELYAMGRLGDPEAAELEEHLLFCTDCQEALQQADDFTATFRVAARQLQAERAAQVSAWKRFLKWAGMDREHLGMLAPAVALAVVAVVVIVPVSIREPGIETVRLESARGEAGMAVVQAGNRLQMKLDTRGLPELASYRVELVDSNGAPVWNGTVNPTPSGLEVTTNEALSAGQYWLRIHGANDLLREFGVRVTQ